MISQKKIIILIIVLSIIAIVAFSFLASFYFKIGLIPKLTSKPKPPPTGPALEIEGRFKKYDGKSITLESTSSATPQTFETDDSTVIYKCGDFQNINSCVKNKDDLVKTVIVKVFAKGQSALFILYK